MSGGHWDYIQYRFTDITEDIEKLIEQNGKEKTEEELREESWRDLDWYEKYPEDKFHTEYPEEVIEEFKKGVEIIKQAQIYIQRLDWLLSGDDGEESFLKRLKDDLTNLNK
jgi:exonuclease VII small subunit